MWMDTVSRKAGYRGEGLHEQAGEMGSKSNDAMIGVRRRVRPVINTDW